ncbi:hypothetical protein T07_2363 [Trichinella nelsoni]|uniref:Uncharacterized protein n=1 Tax=Trichinella nelsoni TaxID=6336 RepID=A0A0V0RTQ1_9BILA|nr:hypothetical protein T07_2363 [Trichinella nelsoni]
MTNGQRCKILFGIEVASVQLKQNVVTNFVHCSLQTKDQVSLKQQLQKMLYRTGCDALISVKIECAPVGNVYFHCVPRLYICVFCFSSV